MSYADNPGNSVVRQMVQMGIYRAEWRSLVYNGLDEIDAARVVLQTEGARNLGALIADAERARRYANSYRDFRVGASAFAAYVGGNHETVFESLLGANSKPVQGSDIINIHAEHELMIQATERKLLGQTALIPIFVVIGDLQPDQATGNETATLHPCGVCREAFLEPEAPISPESVCVTATPDLSTFEWFSVRSLIRYHNGECATTDGGRVEFGETPLAFTPPLPEREGGPISLAQFETAEYIESDHEIAEKLQLPLMQYVSSLARRNWDR